MVHKAGGQVFLDLKFHDIPNTVAMASGETAKLGVFMFNIHASGGAKMMTAAVDAARSAAAAAAKPKPIVLAVTVLTSMGEPDLRQLGILKNTEDHVVYLASLARDSGCDGVICSVEETVLIRKNLGSKFIIVTPGIRPAGADFSDQKRIATPHHAIEAGADYIVVGRPIIEAQDPAVAATKILQQMGV
jgi:orotidine-5'-phosphate decarboxylase